MPSNEDFVRRNLEDRLRLFEDGVLKQSCFYGGDSEVKQSIIAAAQRTSGCFCAVPEEYEEIIASDPTVLVLDKFHHVTVLTLENLRLFTRYLTNRVRREKKTIIFTDASPSQFPRNLIEDVSMLVDFNGFYLCVDGKFDENADYIFGYKTKRREALLKSGFLEKYRIAPDDEDIISSLCNYIMSGVYKAYKNRTPPEEIPWGMCEAFRAKFVLPTKDAHVPFLPKDLPNPTRPRD